jgi:predicted transcriptional regulator
MITETNPPNVLTEVRDLVPRRALAPSEIRPVVELQATRFLKLMGIDGPPVPIEQLLTSLPYVEVVRTNRLPTSGASRWTGTTWLILISADEPPVRQRATLAHELAHIVLHPNEATILPSLAHATSEERLERACEYFAACLLMPRPWIKHAYSGDGIQDVPSLARLFDVSWGSMQTRLEQSGMVSTELGRSA